MKKLFFLFTFCAFFFFTPVVFAAEVVGLENSTYATQSNVGVLGAIGECFNSDDLGTDNYNVTGLSVQLNTTVSALTLDLYLFTADQIVQNDFNNPIATTSQYFSSVTAGSYARVDFDSPVELTDSDTAYCLFFENDKTIAPRRTNTDGEADAKYFYGYDVLGRTSSSFSTQYSDRDFVFRIYYDDSVENEPSGCPTCPTCPTCPEVLDCSLDYEDEIGFVTGWSFDYASSSTSSPVTATKWELQIPIFVWVVLVVPFLFVGSRLILELIILFRKKYDDFS